MPSRPILSKAQVEIVAAGILAEHAPAVLSEPQPTPLTTIVDNFVAGGRLSLVSGRDLGSMVDGRRILGIFRQGVPSVIELDLALVSSGDDGKFRFTLAHELGHFLLHAGIDRLDDGGFEKMIVDTDREVSSLYSARSEASWSKHSGSKNVPKTLRTDRDFIEWQANSFAAALLMPEPTVHVAVKSIQERLGIFPYTGRVFVESLDYSISDLNAQLRELARLYLISQTAACNRLRSLGILDDRRLT